MTSAILFETLDSTREEIVEKMRAAIQGGRKRKLSRTDFEELAIILAGKIIHLNRTKADSEAAVKAICDAEIQMLEEGYPHTSLNSKYLPIYTRQIKEAIAQGKIKLTKLNSYPKETAQGTIQKHFALDYLTYSKSIQVAIKSNTTQHNNDRQDQDRQDQQQPVDSDESKRVSENGAEVAKPSTDAVQDSKKSTSQPSQIDLKDLKALQNELQALKTENLNLKKENAGLKGDRQLLNQLRQILAEESEINRELVQSYRAESLPVEPPVAPPIELDEVTEPEAPEYQNTFYSEEIQAEGRAQKRAATLFNVIQQWNQLNPEFSFAITQGLLVKTFHVNQKAANIFLKNNASILQNYHHHVINVSTMRGHNRQAGRDVDKLKAFVEKKLLTAGII